MSQPPRLAPGFRLVALERCASTNDEASRLAAAGAEEGTLVWAREQETGRGRRGRRWHSPRGNLYLSLVLRPAAPPAEAALLGLVAAVAAADALASLLPQEADVRLKWPNDLLVNGRKAGGILLESGGAGGRSIAWLVVGIGINAESSPEGAAFPATCLAREGGAGLAVETLLEAVSRTLRKWLDIWAEEGFEPVRAAWLARAWRLGRTIEVGLENGVLSGLFADLDASGTLVLALADGTHRALSAGDVMARPAGA